MESVVSDLANSSPLIMWLKNKLPFLLKSLLISYLFAFITKTPNTFIFPLFIILSVVASYAPKIGESLDYGLGYLIALSLISGTTGIGQGFRWH